LIYCKLVGKTYSNILKFQRNGIEGFFSL